jgi:hypothetical protein
MFRLYLLNLGHVVLGEDCDVQSLEEAVAAGEEFLAAQLNPGDFDGIEVWQGRSLLYASARQ